MIKKLGFIAMFVFAQLGTLPSPPINPVDVNAQTLSSTAGWYEIPNTKIRPVCPPNDSNWSYANTCQNITYAWNSAVFDTTRNRLIVWGGGHTDYHGNELYALNLNANPITMTRLNTPSPLEPTSCGNDGSTGDNPIQASSRHTYDHIVYMSHVDRMFVFGGSGVPCGFMLNDTWTFSFTSMTWQRMNPSGTAPEGNYGRVTGYNPATQKVYIHDSTNLYAYSYESNAYTTLATNGIGQYSTGVMDTKHQMFVIVGQGAVYAYDVSAGSTYTRQTWTTTGGDAVVSASWPGVAYDPVTDRIVAWAGGNTVYSLNTTTKVWTPITYAGGPTALPLGTYKRWAYSPASGVFVVVNSVDSNAFTLRLAAGNLTSDTTAPTVPTNLSGTAVSSSQINLSWTASTDNVGVTSYIVSRNGTQVGTPTTTSFSDTGLSASTTYVYTVSASDAAGNTSSPPTSAGVTTQQASGGGSDFSARCSAAGVVLCQGFDNTTTDIVQNTNLFPAGDGYWGGSLDTTTKVSGAGSLKFTLRGSSTEANIAGSWVAPLRASFGAGQTFYAQFQMRLSPEMISNIPAWQTGLSNGTAWKTVDFHRSGSTCGQIELTNNFQQNVSTPWATMYTGCGANGFSTDVNGIAHGGGGGIYIQQGSLDHTSGYWCQYPNYVAGTGNGTGCFKYIANTWLTFYYKFTIGTWGTASSTIEAFVAVNGGPYLQWLNSRNTTLLTDGAGLDHYDYMTIMNYMTGLSHAGGADAYTWYDELIVSSQPIAAPGSGGSVPNPSPSAPINLRIQ